MSANDLKKDAILLLIEDRKMLLPICEEAFEIADGPRRHIGTRYKDAVFIWVDGTVRKIKEIKILGPWGLTWYGKLFGYLNSNWKIEIVFGEDLHWTLDEIKNILRRFIKYDFDRVEPILSLEDPCEEILKQLENKNSVEEIFELLKLKDDEGCLDIL